MARREPLKEAECAIRGLLPACHFLTSPGITSENVAVFIGHVVSEGLGGNHGLAEEAENKRPFVLRFGGAVPKLETGQIANAPAVAALY